MAALADAISLYKAQTQAPAAQIDTSFSAFMGPPSPLSAHMPFMSPSLCLSIVILYLAFVTFAPPLLSSSKKPSLNLKPAMRVYNVLMVLMSAYMGVKSVALARASNSSLFCVPLARGEAGREMAQLVWLYTFSKVVEFLDTFFMVAEGRLRQLTVLHVYHHVSIFAYSFATCWVMPGSDAYFSLAGNSFIHVLMYSYYLLASFGYSPWWKYYITKCQILQFCCFCVQAVYVGYMGEGKCDFPGILSKTLLWYMLSFIVLFMHFLLTNQGTKKTKVKKVQ